MVRHTSHESTDPKMYLHRRKGVFYFRRRIPLEFKNRLTPEERSAFHHSLGTTDRQEALAHRPNCIAATDTILRKVRERSSTGGSLGSRPSIRRANRSPIKKFYQNVFSQLSDNDLVKLHNRWFARSLDETRQSYLDVHVHWGAEGKTSIREDLCYDLSHLRSRPDDVGHAMLVSPVVQKILDEMECAIPSDGFENAAYRRFYNLIHQGMVRLKTIALEIVDLGFESSSLSETTTRAEGVSKKEEGGKTLNELIEDFKSAPKRRNLKPETHEDYEFTYRVLRETLGASRDVKTITREDIRRVRDVILRLPARATQRFRGLTVPEMLEKTDLLKLEPAHTKTFNKKVHQISAIFHHAEDEQYIVSSPARGLGIPLKKSSGTGKSLSIEKLNKIFSGSIYQDFIASGEARFEANHELKPCFFWVPLIGLFSGMRSNEILQLRAHDGIVEHEEIMAFSALSEVKTKYSFRLVPIHPVLMNLGFLRYLENVRKNHHEMLFPDARPACDGKYSNWFQKPFSRYLKSIGVKDGRQDCFHAFRHNFTEGLRRADVETDVRRALTGHSRADNAEALYGGEPLRRLALYLGKLDYPGLNLTHLRPS